MRHNSSAWNDAFRLVSKGLLHDQCAGVINPYPFSSFQDVIIPFLTMHTQNRMAHLKKVLIAAAFLAPYWAMADEPVEESGEQQVEEIVVVGERSTAQLRHEIEAANMVVYETYNELNQDDDYDIECRKEAPIGSQVLRTYCRARIYWESRSPREEEEDTLATTRRSSNHMAHDRILQEKMRTLAKTNPILLNAIVKREILRRELASREK